MSTGEQIKALVRASVKALAWIRFEPIVGEHGDAVRLHIDTADFNGSHSWVGEDLDDAVGQAYEAVRAGDVAGVAVAPNGAGIAGGSDNQDNETKEV